MNKITCSIVADLLPLYIDNLTSDESDELIDGHLKDCSGCKGLLTQLSKPIITDSPETPKEIDYLKKIKHKRRIAIFMTTGICAIIFMIISVIGLKVFVLGSPINPYAMDYSYEYNEQTRELTITGKFNLAQTELSRVKVEEDKRLLNTINITIYGAERYSRTKEYNKEFTKTIKIPDNGSAWSVYLLGESPHETAGIWSNYYDLEDNAKNILLQYLIENEGFLPNKNGLFTNPEEETSYPGISSFMWEWHEDADNWGEGAPLSVWAVSTDGSKIFVYDEDINDWVEK